MHSVLAEGINEDKICKCGKATGKQMCKPLTTWKIVKCHICIFQKSSHHIIWTQK